MSSCGGFDRPPASLRLVVSSVVWLGLHLNVELELLCAAGDRPFQRGERRHGDAAGRDSAFYKMIKVIINVFASFPVVIYLHMLDTSGLVQIGGITKKGSTVGLVLMSWSQDTK